LADTEILNTDLSTSVCMCVHARMDVAGVCIYLVIHIYINTFTYLDIHTYIYIHKCIHKYTYTHIYMNTSMHACTHRHTGARK